MGSVTELDRIRPWRTDGSARCAAPPSSRRAASRTSRSPRTCSASTTGSSGTRAEGSSKRTSDNRGSGRASLASWVHARAGRGDAPGRQLSLPPEVREGQGERLGPGDQDHVISYSPPGCARIHERGARDLAHPAPGAVALDGALEPAAHRHPDPQVLALARHSQCHQAAAAEDARALERRLEVGLAAEAVPPLHARLTRSGAGGP